MLHDKRGCDSERPAHHDEEWPPLAATRESPRIETKTQHSHKSINQSINQSSMLELLSMVSPREVVTERGGVTPKSQLKLLDALGSGKII